MTGLNATWDPNPDPRAGKDISGDTGEIRKEPVVYWLMMPTSFVYCITVM